MYAAARLILRDSELAEDAVQDALVAAWRDLGGLRDPDRFDAWLHRILVRTCYRAARHYRQRLHVEIGMTEDSGRFLDDTQLSVAARDQVARGFARLTPDQRAVVVLHHYLGYSLAEAAEILGIPVGTMQSRLFRALNAMRAAIEADDRTPMLAGRQG